MLRVSAGIRVVGRPTVVGGFTMETTHSRAAYAHIRGFGLRSDKLGACTQDLYLDLLRGPSDGDQPTAVHIHTRPSR